MHCQKQPIFHVCLRLLRLVSCKIRQHKLKLLGFHQVPIFTLLLLVSGKNNTTGTRSGTSGARSSARKIPPRTLAYTVALPGADLWTVFDLGPTVEDITISIEGRLEGLNMIMMRSEAQRSRFLGQMLLPVVGRVICRCAKNNTVRASPCFACLTLDTLQRTAMESDGAGLSFMLFWMTKIERILRTNAAEGVQSRVLPHPLCRCCHEV
ncbi:hypothetical protein EDC04DRAFT_2215782 [Pisolithus marmoratus]|nr:hypothetical protein EDC04DRAFT_2215782 [Pisolithus marmoratus]